MTFVKINGKPAAKSFNNLMDDLFAGMPSIIRDDLISPTAYQHAPVNITERENDFLMAIVAPGFEKTDFKIQLDKNELTVSAEAKKETVNENEKQILKEFKSRSFKRSFTVDQNIDCENIVAKYENGVLTLNLPKKVDVKEATKNITIL
jgi:HSP20 family protein